MNAAQNKNATPTKIYCNICKKAFSSKNAFVQHEKSKKHLKEVKDAEARKANRIAWWAVGITALVGICKIILGIYQIVKLNP